MHKSQRLTRFVIAAVSLTLVLASTYAATSQGNLMLIDSVREFFGIAPTQTIVSSLQPETAVAVSTPRPLSPLINRTWNNTGTDFNAGASWGGTAPGSADVAVFSTSEATQPNLSSSLTIQELNFSSSLAFGYDLTSSNTSTKLTLTNTGTGTTSAINSGTTSGTNTIDAPVIMGAAAAAATQTVSQSGDGGSLVVNGAISSTNSITLNTTMTGSSSITFSGSNTYTGSTGLAGASINANTIFGIGNNNAFSTGPVSLNSGLTLVAANGVRNIGNAITWAANGTIGGTNDLNFSGNFTGSGSTTRTLTSNNSGVTTLSGNIFLAPDNATARGLIIAGSGPVVISGIIANNSAGNTLASNFTLNSTGTLTLSGTNTYTGTTTLIGGTLVLGNKSAFGNSSNVAWNGVTTSASTDLTAANAIANTGSFGAAGNVFKGSNNLELSGVLTNIVTAQTITNNISGGALTLSNTLNLSNNSTARTVTFNGTGNTLISGVIANGSTSISNLAYSGSRTLTPSNTNTFTGTTTVSGGGTISVSNIGNAGASGNVGAGTTINLGSTTTGGTLLYTGPGETTDKLINLNGTTGGATIEQAGTGLLKFTSLVPTPGAGAKTLILQGSTTGTGEIAAVIHDNSGINPTSLNKTGSGSWTLSGLNSYTGATNINAGTLLITGQTAPESTVTVNNTCILGGTGSILGPVNINSGGKLAPGLSPGILNIGNGANPSSVTFNSGSTFSVKIGGTTAGNFLNNYDQLNVIGTVNLGGATLDLSPVGGFVPAAGQTFTIINNDSTDPITGTFAGLAESGLIPNFLGSGLNATISYAGGSGNDVVITILTSTPSVNLSVNSNRGSEAGATAIIVTATASTAVSGSQTVDLAVTGTGITVGDFTLTPSTITILNGQTTGTATFTVVDDATYEGQETATITESNPSAGLLLGATANQDITITDNDQKPFLSIDNVNHLEGNAGTTTYSFTVTKTGATGLNASVDFATGDNTGTQPSDYTAASGTLTFLPADTTKQVVVSINGDTVVEPDESFFVSLSNPVDALIQTGTGTGSIVNDDSSMQFDSDIYSGPETSTVIVTVVRSGDLSGTSTVDYTSSNGTATSGTCGSSGSDYVTSSGTLIFDPGVTTQKFDVTLCGDFTSENPAETVNLTLSDPTGGRVGDQDTATLNILDAATQFVNPTPIFTTDGNPGSPNPSTIEVTGQPPVIGGIRLTLFNINRATSDDLLVLLAAPGGQTFVGMASVGGINPMNGTTITLEDASPNFMPQAGPITNGQNYRPTDCGLHSGFGLPAPAPPYNEPACSEAFRKLGFVSATFGNTFAGTNPNGTWSLYIKDDPGLDLAGMLGGGEVVNGWGIQFLIPTAAPASISGQVRTSSGVGIRNVVVTVSGASLTRPITTTTGSFGYYNVSGLTAGQAYIVSVNARHYTFTQPVRAVQLLEDVGNFDFVAEQ